MITGHYGLAAGAKSLDRRAPLWSLMLATQWLDVVFIPLFLLGIETIETLPGGGYGKVVIHADYTHSLIGALVLSATFGAVAWWRWDRRLGLLLGAVAFSHWVLDLIVHRGDMPILPGNAGGLPLLGFGFWEFPFCSSLFEGCFFLVGSFFTWVPLLDVELPPPTPGCHPLFIPRFFCLLSQSFYPSPWCFSGGGGALRY